MAAIELTPEQSAALDEQGIIHGETFVLMRPAAFVELLGFESVEELRGAVDLGLKDIEDGRVAEWNVEEFLSRMHQSHSIQQ